MVGGWVDSGWVVAGPDGAVLVGPLLTDDGEDRTVVRGAEVDNVVDEERGLAPG